MSPLPAALRRAPLPDRGNIRGGPVRAILDHFARARGEAAVQAAIAALPDPLRRRAFPAPHAPGYGLYASAWVPGEALGMIADELLADVDAHQRALMARQASRAVVNETLGGLHKALFRTIASPELMQRNHMAFWRQHFDTGQVEVETLELGAQRHVYRDWRGHHPFICQVTFECVPHLLRAMRLGAPRLEEYRCRDHCGSEHDHCEGVFRWSP